MKKLFAHLSLLCLMAVLLVPMVACKGKEAEVDETPAATTETTTMEEPTTTTPMDTGMMGSDMGTDMTTSEPMTTDAQPPAGQ
ncbi:MAG TPA: hypothetical protein VJ725_13605 [Thermoanaerobaculia bacterium]|nr:hypothetical protein [Thermoanaerobaculia bacterium]